MKSLLIAGLSILCGIAWAGETAYTVRATELKAKPFSDAAMVASLVEGSKVEILSQQSSWTQVKAPDGTGWLKMLSLRLDSQKTPTKSSDNGLGALFNLAKTGSSGSTGTTGVRGLSEEKLKDPHPNPEALAMMQTYAVKKADAQKFAKDGKLNAQPLDFVASASGSKK